MSESNTRGSERSAVVEAALAGLDEGFHYAVLAYNDDNGPVEVAWNHERDSRIGSLNDDFADKSRSMQHRERAIEYQQQFSDSSEQATLTEASA